MSTETTWYYAEGTNTIGPFNHQTISKMLSAGLLNADTQVIEEGSQSWSRLAESPLQGLMHATPTPINSKKPKKIERTMLQTVQEFICLCSGLKPLVDFKLSFLYEDALRRRSRSDIDNYFSCGAAQSTPNIEDVKAEWPRPWFYIRMLGFGLLVLLTLCFTLEFSNNEKLIPGLIIVGAFFVPLTCVALFFELNILRNVSLYQIAKLVVAGGVLSLVVALILYATIGKDLTFLGAMSAGIVEETAKVIAAVILLRGVREYRWILNGLLIGAAVGAGFAGFESAGYIFDSLFECITSGNGAGPFYETVAARAVFAPFCHVIWTASVVGALWRVKRDRNFEVSMLLQKDFIRILLFVVALHMIWNSNLLFSFARYLVFWKGELYLWLTSFVGSWYLALLLVQEGISEVRSAQNIAGESINSVDPFRRDADEVPGNRTDPVKATGLGKKITAIAVVIALVVGLGVLGHKQARDRAKQEEYRREQENHEEARQEERSEDKQRTTSTWYSLGYDTGTQLREFDEMSDDDLRDYANKIGVEIASNDFPEFARGYHDGRHGR